MASPCSPIRRHPRVLNRNRRAQCRPWSRTSHRAAGARFFLGTRPSPEIAARNGALPAAFAAPRPRGPTTQTARQASSQFEFGPTHTDTDAEQGGDRPSGTDMNRVAAARTTVCYRKPVPGTTKHTVCSRTAALTSTRAFGGMHWVANWALDSGRRPRRCNGGGGAAQIPCEDGARMHGFCLKRNS
jgi:hypothetical protein